MLVHVLIVTLGLVRRALHSAWIMRGFIEDRLTGAIETALEFFTSALEVLEWGSRTFSHLEKEQRGGVFEPTFIRAVKSFRLDSLMGVGLVMYFKLYPADVHTGLSETSRCKLEVHA